MSKYSGFFLVCTGVILIAFTYWFVSEVKLVPSGDETISYLCATGNQEAYTVVTKKGGVYGKQTEAAQWKAFLSNHTNSFSNIGKDLSETDLHPPLYFWLLHAFTLLPLPLFTTGLLVNFLLHVLSLFMLLRVCRQLDLSPVPSLFAGVGWCLSPAVISVGFYARQYELLGLINLCLASCFLAYHQSRKTIFLLCMLLLATLGMLTHYLFIYFSFSYVGFILFTSRDKKTMAKLLLVSVLALLLVMLIHPGIFNQFALQQERAQPFIAKEIVSRLGKVILGFVQVLIPVLSLKGFFLALPKLVTAVVSAAAIAVAVFFVAKNRKKLNLRAPSVSPFILWMLFCSIALATLPYLFFLTPFHAMGGQYLVLVYPFLLIAAATLLNKRVKALAAVLSIFCVGFILQLVVFFYQHRTDEVLLSELDRSHLIIVKSVDRRGFLRLVPYLNRQQIIMSEDAARCDHPDKNTLLISQEPLSGVGGFCQKVNSYDLRDGVVFYTTFTSSCACVELRSK